jgi:hypothetical protein
MFSFNNFRKVEDATYKVFGEFDRFASDEREEVKMDSCVPGCYSVLSLSQTFPLLLEVNVLQNKFYNFDST